MTRITEFLAIAFFSLAAAGYGQTMEEMSRALGVNCEYCHSAPRNSGQPEPKKDVARAMMAMTRELNLKISAATGKPAGDVTRVECATCHHGVAIPQPLPAIILRTVADKGGAAAANQYRELRKQYYGRAAYDFSEDALVDLVQRMVEAKPKDAIELLRMNLEFNPESAKSYALIGFAYTRQNDSASAMAALQKSLDIDPNNGLVRGLLEQLREDKRRRARSQTDAGTPAQQ